MNKSRLAQVTAGYALILDGLYAPEGWREDPHLRETATRAARALVDEVCGGMLLSSPPKMTTFPLLGDPEMVVSKGIPVKSLCAHHLLPFTGEAVVGYVPWKKILGLSKLSRLVEWHARRPQVQENLTTMIADDLYNALFHGVGDKGGVGVVIRARHLCMEHRGVGHTSDVVTSALRGCFTEPEVRAEFLHFAER